MFDTRKVIAETLSMVGTISRSVRHIFYSDGAEVELTNVAIPSHVEPAPAEFKVERETIRDAGDSSSYSITWAIDCGEIRKCKKTSSNEM